MAHNDLLIEIQSEYCFRPQECFNSYEEFLAKMEQHSSKDLVYYWRRDSRTIEGAALKTSRPIAPALRYYSVRYSCIFGGQKFEPKSSGAKKLRQSIRNDCPAYIALRASKCGQQLVVISVSNIHNHDISVENTRNLAHTKKLSSDMKQEVNVLLMHNVDKKLIREYVRLKDGKELTTKDLCNIVASLRKNVLPVDSSSQSSKTAELTFKLINYISHHEGSIPIKALESANEIVGLDVPEAAESVFSEMVEERLLEDFDEDDSQHCGGNLAESNHEYVIQIVDDVPREEEIPSVTKSQSRIQERRTRTRWKAPSCFACGSNNRLVRAQLEVLRARRDKLREQTALLRLKKRKLQLEIEVLNRTCT
ncbi:AAEL004955-PA [Aedes aegypti]|uniref:AAEL004955-PA n=1 Tax=Aedes aegypti TaxID=7159 RepID=Q17BJ2_AEDAE|nr:AAEL004955-PA [Aedes aegypti]